MYYIGLDLGQRHDHSAIVIVERRDHLRLVRFVERVPLGVAYPKIVEGIRRLVLQPHLRGNCVLVVDATGVGAPVVDMLRRAGLGCEIIAVTITGGDRETRKCVPKQDLIAGLQTLVEQQYLRIAKNLKHAHLLLREMENMKAARSETGHVRMGAEGARDHDDLVIALALACWRAARRENGFGPALLPVYV
jgi:hypothetical protein